MSQRRQQLSLKNKIQILIPLLHDIAEDNEIFAGMKHVLVESGQPTESFVDMCYDMIQAMITLFRQHKSLVQQSLQDKLHNREKKLHQAEKAYEQSQGNTDDLLQQL